MNNFKYLLIDKLAIYMSSLVQRTVINLSVFSLIVIFGPEK